MTTTTSEITEVLNDLIKINYDRIEGYGKAAEESKVFDSTLHPIFMKMADESRLNVSELTEHIEKLGGEEKNGSTALGKIYRAWMDVKAEFTGKDRVSILDSCEFGEDEAQKAYDDALGTDVDLDVETIKIIASQKETLKESHDTIKKMRDSGK